MEVRVVVAGPWDFEVDRGVVSEVGSMVAVATGASDVRVCAVVMALHCCSHWAYCCRHSFHSVYDWSDVPG